MNLDVARAAAVDPGKRGRGRPLGSVKAPPEPPPPPFQWAEVADGFCLPFDQILIALGSAPMPKDQKIAFAESWGKVIDKYLPTLGGKYKEEMVAVGVTFMIFAPAVRAYQGRAAAKLKTTEGNGNGQPSSYSAPSP